MGDRNNPDLAYWRAQDILDSRDVTNRVEELEWQQEEQKTEPESVHALDEDELEELAALKALTEDASSSPDWAYGEGLIADSYFEDYARELANDIGAVDANASWPGMFIDWEAAADALKIDYFSVELDGVTFWIRG